MRIVLLAALAVLPAAGMAQQVYRCGAAYQAQPCDGGKALDIKATAPAPNHERAKTLCDVLLQARLKDPESARLVTEWRYIGAQRYQGEAAVAYGRMVNGKNDFGGYTGEKATICYLTPDGQRMLGLTGG